MNCSRGRRDAVGYVPRPFLEMPAGVRRNADPQPSWSCRRAAECGGSAFLLVLMLLWAAAVVPPCAFGQAGQRYIQAGAGALPGIGLQGGYVAPRSFFTVEGLLYVDGSPPFAGGEGSVQFSGGLGGSIRILGILRAVGSPGYQDRDFDVGLRFGPSLFFTVGESSRGENPFSLFLEPFLRATSTLGGNRTFFAELGIQRPIVRAGVWFEL